MGLGGSGLGVWESVRRAWAWGSGRANPCLALKKGLQRLERCLEACGICLDVAVLCSLDLGVYVCVYI